MTARMEAFDYLVAVASQVREMLDWRKRWDERTPEDEPALREEWDQLANRGHMLLAAPVEGEE